MNCKLSFMLILFLSNTFFAQSPHGKLLKNDCVDCHSAERWRPLQSEMKFDHQSTDFNLIGQHKTVPCKSCHQTLVFSKTDQNCNACHFDAHNLTTSFVCEKCHTPETWLVTNVRALHQNSRFPLVGMHSVLPCEDCHKNFAKYQFDIIGVKCFDCHASQYYAASNHAVNGFNTQCETCHNLANDWSFYHDGLFPINSGSHNGTWKVCGDCHTSETNYLVFSCLNCHEHSQSKMDSEHKGEVSGYVYESRACYSCHPQGSGEGD
ncbi:MAG: cytochrome c3 family protein [Ignavibacteriaceae bacterium]|nr:cytochrome c3 family protein [Ignavibacteriaceae bacterium]